MKLSKFFFPCLILLLWFQIDSNHDMNDTHDHYMNDTHETFVKLWWRYFWETHPVPWKLVNTANVTDKQFIDIAFNGDEDWGRGIHASDPVMESGQILKWQKMSEFNKSFKHQILYVQLSYIPPITFV